MSDEWRKVNNDTNENANSTDQNKIVPVRSTNKEFSLGKGGNIKPVTTTDVDKQEK